MSKLISSAINGFKDFEEFRHFWGGCEFLARKLHMKTQDSLASHSWGQTKKCDQPHHDYSTPKQANVHNESVRNTSIHKYQLYKSMSVGIAFSGGGISAAIGAACAWNAIASTYPSIDSLNVTISTVSGGR